MNKVESQSCNKKVLAGSIVCKYSISSISIISGLHYTYWPEINHIYRPLEYLVTNYHG